MGGEEGKVKRQGLTTTEDSTKAKESSWLVYLTPNSKYLREIKAHIYRWSTNHNLPTLLCYSLSSNITLFFLVHEVIQQISYNLLERWNIYILTIQLSKVKITRPKKKLITFYQKKNYIKAFPSLFYLLLNFSMKCI